MINGCKPTTKDGISHKECSSCLLDGQSNKCREFRKKAHYKLNHREVIK